MFIASTITDNSQFWQPYLERFFPWLYVETYVWTVVGIIGQLTFASRFIIQWIFSEKLGRVVVPVMFWHLSFWGGLINFFYCLHCDKSPLILGSFFLPFIYGRNLWLHYHPRVPATDATDANPS